MPAYTSWGMKRGNIRQGLVNKSAHEPGQNRPLATPRAAPGMLAMGTERARPTGKSRALGSGLSVARKQPRRRLLQNPYALSSQCCRRMDLGGSDMEESEYAAWVGAKILRGQAA